MNRLSIIILRFGWLVPLGFGLWILFNFGSRLLWLRDHVSACAPFATWLGAVWLIATIVGGLLRRHRDQRQPNPADTSTPTEAFDFLYVDGQRIARIQAQSDDMGLATQKSRELLDRAAAEAGAEVAFVNVKGTAERQSKNTAVFDPSWRLPVEFTTRKPGHDFKKLDNAVPGDIITITITGTITLRDYEFLDRVLINEGYTPQGLRRLAKLPDLIHASISDGQVATWSTLNSACTTASTGDLAMKFGRNIPGPWTLIGILDQEIDYLQSATVGNEFDEIAELARTRFGCPPGSIGITPLVIYRIVQI